MSYSAATFDSCLPRLVGYLRAGLDLEMARELEQEIGFGFDEEMFFLAYTAARIAVSGVAEWFKADWFRLGGRMFHAAGPALYLFSETPMPGGRRLTWIAEGCPGGRSAYEALARAWLASPWPGQVRRPDGSGRPLAEAQAAREQMLDDVRSGQP